MSKQEVNLEQKKFQEHQKFARDSVSNNVNTYYKSKAHDLDKINKALEDPVKNYKALQEVSEYIYHVGGVYQRIIQDTAFMPEYDCMLTPKGINKMKPTTRRKTYLEAAMIVDKVNPKHTFKGFGLKLLRFGELYIYEIEDEDTIVYKQMPPEICRISSIENGLCKYAINLDALKNKNLLATMPKDIRKLYEKYQNKSIKEDKLIDKKWYELEKNAFAFNFIDPFLPKGYPPLSHLFKGASALDRMTNKLLSDEEVEMLKVIHNKIPTNDEGELLIDPEIASKYHYSVKENLPKNVTIATTPLEMKSISFQGNNKQTNYRQESLDSLYQNAGVSKEKFSGERNSNQAIKISTMADEMVALQLVRIFEPYLNYKLRQNKKTSNWRVKILDNTYYNKSDYFRDCKEAASNGSSRLKFMASCGLSPSESLMLREVENDLGLDELLTPLLNGQNTSSKLIEDSKTGRPKAEDDGDVPESEE